MSTYWAKNRETGEEVEIEYTASGGFYPETWGYYGGTPAETPEICLEDDLPEWLDEDRVIEEIIERLRDEERGY